MATDKEFESYLETLPDQVVRNTKVITPKEAGQDYMLHVSTDTKIRKFIPRIGTRQMAEEDRTVPRVCVAPHFLGCMIGYSKSSADFVKASDGKEDWLGGWKIYGLKFSHCLRPNKQMVPDARISDEHWLVTHDKDTVEYYPFEIGKIFIRSIVLVARSGTNPAEDMECYLEINHEDGIYFSKNIHLKKGYHRIQGPNFWMLDSWKDISEFHITEITADEYRSSKKACADLLSLELEPPAFMKW